MEDSRELAFAVVVVLKGVDQPYRLSNLRYKIHETLFRVCFNITDNITISYLSYFSTNISIWITKGKKLQKKAFDN